jgi:type II secretory pathway pseudopilin PulG
LLVVVAIFLIITAIAVPRFLRARMTANEASAAASLKQIGIANVAFAAVYNAGYAGELADLGPGCASPGPTCADLIDSVISSGVKSGYQFTYFATNADPTTATPNDTYSVTGEPVLPNNTGVSTFCFDNRVSIMRDIAGSVPVANAAGCDPAWGTPL